MIETSNYKLSWEAPSAIVMELQSHGSPNWARSRWLQDVLCVCVLVCVGVCATTLRLLRDPDFLVYDLQMKFRKACWLVLSRVFDREPALIEQLEVFSENNIDGDIGVFSHQLPTHGVFMLSSEMRGKELNAITKLNDGEDLFKALGLQASISQKFGLRAPSKEISGYCRLWKNRRPCLGVLYSTPGTAVTVPPPCRPPQRSMWSQLRVKPTTPKMLYPSADRRRIGNFSTQECLLGGRGNIYVAQQRNHEISRRH